MKNIMKNKKVIFSIISVLAIIAVFVFFNISKQEPKLQFEVPENLEIKIDETKLLEVKTNSKSLVSFESKDSSIITVDDKGNLKGIKEGSTEVTVKLNDTTKICKLTVVKSETSNEVNNDSSTGSYSPEQPTNGGSTSSNNGSTTTNKKPSSNTGSSSNKPSNGGSTSGGGSSSTPAPTPKPEPKPDPTPEPTYSYFGKQAYNWVINKGGKDIGGSAYLGNPDKNGYGGVSTIDFMAKVQNVGTKNTDYIITLNAGILIHGYMPEILDNCFENSSTVKSNLLSGKTNFTVDGRNYSAQSTRFGYVINVSAKAN